MQEDKLSCALEKVFQIPAGSLAAWNCSSSSSEARSGCLGEELQRVLVRRGWQRRNSTAQMTFGR